MPDLPLPDYYNSYLVKPEELEHWTDERFMTGYFIINCDFEFPSNIKYPL